ncbi:hypothetical protein HQ29_05055 [Porphyromonas canoris]|uniref:hypothetical protein n=1 Tax=Porphyromonas canoris TaxID=36875 RepID=UPI00051DBCB8|nr:hypothetical protein [Porphyromonas canoris]KGL52983.1 hypothetical protein HQ29_05055 [Porphyromonas canoris]
MQRSLFRIFVDHVVVPSKGGQNAEDSSCIAANILLVEGSMEGETRHKICAVRCRVKGEKASFSSYFAYFASGIAIILCIQ